MTIDTHTHFYDPSRPEGVPWPDPKDEVLYRTVLPEHCKALAEPLGVTGTVVVEASAWLEDNQWILDLAAEEPFIVGFVGNVNIQEDGFVRHLDRFAANPLFRGIRLGSGALDAARNDGHFGRLAAVADRDLSLDVLVPPEFLPTLAGIAAAFPTLRIVIDHLAHVRIDGNPPDPAWTQGIRTVAERPNAFMKVSALVEMARDRPAPEELDYYAPTLDVLWEAFGSERLLYGSNWPVSERFAPYGTVHRLVRDWFATKGEEASTRYFSQNAKTVYKWLDRA